MAKNSCVFWGHGAGTRAAAAGGAREEATGHQIEPSATCFISLNFEHFVFYCESRLL